MEYIGENLLPGQIGHLCVVLSFVAALLATFAYFFATKKRETAEGEGWRNIGRFSFLMHGLATLGIIGSLFYLLTGKMYEYQYAWANVSDDLPGQYIFSAFWKEQQGSFLLWSFWHIVLGIVLILRAGKWEAPVLTIVALAETFIASMILGLYFGDFRLGASPFELLRDTMDAPIFAQADYLTQIKGNGLNPLLQNYWMTIHPPTLFLGFASTIVPFAYAVAGLWTREHKEWLKPALAWSLFSGAILGTGILMGGAWAYEALSFAGYWAWDPVENSSLVPWITLVAGIHTNLVARSTGYSIRSTYGFYLMTFVLILYSTYLTRSGILGDTSAHAFTEMGLGFQLLLFIFAFSILGLALWILRYKEVPEIKKEESATSREFWMFIGSLVLLFSAILITGATSLPVFNKLFGTDWALKDPVEHHNRYQLWIAVFIGFLTAIGQWMRYGERNWTTYAKKFGLHIGIAAVGAAALTALNALWINVNAWQLYTLLFAGMFTVVANADYLISVLKGNLKLAGSAISHLGFGILVLGVMSTGLGKDWISTNSFAMEGLIEGMGADALNKNVLLMKEAPMPIRDFTATYLKDTVERQTRTFTVKFQRRDEAGYFSGEEFTLTPNVMYDREFTKVVASNPSTKHYWNYDIFTHVSSLPLAELDPKVAKQQEDSLKFEQYEAVVGDTIFTKKHFIIVEGLTSPPTRADYKSQKGDVAAGLKLRVCNLDDPKSYLAEPFILLNSQGIFRADANVSQLATRIRLSPEKSASAMLRLRDFKIKQGETFEFNGNRITLLGFDNTPQHPDYQKQEGDIAVAAQLQIVAPDGSSHKAWPVYCIRGREVINLPYFVKEIGLHVNLQNILPSEQSMIFVLAQPNNDKTPIPVEIAENAARSDYIVLEAIIFPGINFVWIGSIMMMLGLGIALWRRLNSRQ